MDNVPLQYMCHITIEEAMFMKKPRIISMIKVNGEWVDQDSLSPDITRKIVTETIIRAALNAGFDAARVPTEKTA